MTTQNDPALDPETGYHTGEFFRDNRLKHYLGLAHSSGKPLGVLLLKLDECVNVDVKTVAKTIEGMELFDEMARDENTYYLLKRVADDGECQRLRQELSGNLLVALKTSSFKIAAKSFAVQNTVNSEQVISELETSLL